MKEILLTILRFFITQLGVGEGNKDLVDQAHKKGAWFGF